MLPCALAKVGGQGAVTCPRKLRRTIPLCSRSSSSCFLPLLFLLLLYSSLAFTSAGCPGGRPKSATRAVEVWARRATHDSDGTVSSQRMRGHSLQLPIATRACDKGQFSKPTVSFEASEPEVCVFACDPEEREMCVPSPMTRRRRRRQGSAEELGEGTPTHGNECTFM